MMMRRAKRRTKMPDCELLSTCPYFNDKTYGMTESYKKRYCKGDHAWCGRYMAFKSLERELERKKHARAGRTIQGIRE